MTGLKAKQVIDIAARWLPNPNVLTTVLLWTMGFVYVIFAILKESGPSLTRVKEIKPWVLANQSAEETYPTSSAPSLRYPEDIHLDEYLVVCITSLIAIVSGTAVIGLDKLINRVEDSVAIRFCAMLLAGFLGLLIQIGVSPAKFTLMRQFTDKATAVRITHWFNVGVGALFGLLYAIPAWADIVEKRASPSEESPVTDLAAMSSLERGATARKISDIATKFLPNPKVLVAILLWTTAIISFFCTDEMQWIFRVNLGYLCRIVGIVVLVLGTALIGLEKLKKERVGEVSEDSGCFAMLVAGFLGILIQVGTSLLLLSLYWFDYFLESYGGLFIFSSYDTKLFWVSGVCSGVFGLLYAIASLAEMAGRRG